MRTKEGLAAARASGKRLGRPKGKLGQSKLNGKEDDIQRLLTLKVSKRRLRRSQVWIARLSTISCALGICFPKVHDVNDNGSSSVFSLAAHT